MSTERKFCATNEGPSDERTAAACYIATLSTDLAVIAKRQGLDTLAYLLDMARLEAENHFGSGPESS
jgi:hypothetical protein